MASASSRRRRSRRGRQKHLRYAVAISALFAATVLISLALSQSGRKPPLERAVTTDTASAPVGILRLLVGPADLPSGFGMYEASPQTLADVVRNASDPSSEESRLVRQGFVEAAIASSVKPDSAPSDLSGTAVTSQVIRFSSDKGAVEQVAHDVAGALGADFRFEVVSTDRVPLGEEAWLIRGTAGEGVGVSAVVMRYKAYQFATVYMGRNPIPDETVMGIARKQLAKVQEST